jgi:hypothetical protein
VTAEIAILNKLAVALAADSAVTIGQPPNAKIYNTVNKIFELSCTKPIGIMVYGRLDFMGIPYEVLIKEYRHNLGDRSFARVSDYLSDFRRYLSQDVQIDDGDKVANLQSVVTNYFGRLQSEIQRLIWQDIAAHGTFRKAKVNGLAKTLVREKIKELRSSEFAAGYLQKKLPVAVVPLVDQVIDRQMSSWAPNEGTKTLLREYAGYVLAKKVLSPDLRTGIVVAGFGEDDIFPSLEAMELDGVLLDRVKYINDESVDIDRKGPEADILGFAQDDMVKSFVDGVDPSLRRYVDEMLGSGVKETARLILKAILKNTTQEAAAFTAIEPQLDDIITDLSGKIDKRVESTSSRPIKDMVRAMPKQELVTLAASLIEITSLKRKVSRGQETVGGEVDVAIISKSEGFIWTKRKHYFPPELNTRFFKRREAEGN